MEKSQQIKIQLLIKFILFFLMLSCYKNSSLFAQTTASIFHIGSTGNESVEVLSTSTDGKLFVGGVFDAELNTVGETDIFIAQMDGEETKWIQTFGSSGQDEILAMTNNQEHQVLLLASYLNEIQIGDTLLTPNSGSRGHFVLQLDEMGYPLWWKDLSSTAEQALTDILVDNQRQIYICGYFGGELMIDGNSYLAQADQDLFVLKLTSSGDLIWLYQNGISGSIRPQSMVLNSDETTLTLSGIFKGSIGFISDTIQTNTNDFDVFVTQVDTTGNLLWGRKAGGVFEDTNAKILQDEEDNLLVIGDFQGVMKLSESLEITTNGVQDNNLYFLKYSSDGTPLMARSLGGTNFDFVTGAVSSASNQIAVSGYFQETISIDELTVEGIGTINTFVVGLDSTDGHAEWLEAIQSDDLVIGNSLTFFDSQLILGGNFTQNLMYQGQLVENAGFFDAFLLYFESDLTSIEVPFFSKKVLSVFPNPANTELNIITDEFDFNLIIYNCNGQEVEVVRNKKTIHVENLPNGIYFLELQKKNQRLFSKVLIQH